MKIVIMLVVLITSILFPVTTSASTYAKDAVKNGLPIKTLAQATAHCLARVGSGRIVIQSEGTKPGYNEVTEKGKGDKEVVNLLSKMEWDIEVFDESKEVVITFELFDSEQQVLFYDEKKTRWVKTSSGLWFEDATLQRKLVPNPVISIPGAIDAVVYITDKRTGRIEYGRLDVAPGLVTYYRDLIESTDFVGMIEITFQEEDGNTTTEKFGLDGVAGTGYTKPKTKALGKLSIGGADNIYDMGVNPTDLTVHLESFAEVNEVLVRFEVVGSEQHQITIGVVGYPIKGILYREFGKNERSWNYYPFKGVITTTFTPGIKYEMVYVPEELPTPVAQ